MAKDGDGFKEPRGSGAHGTSRRRMEGRSARAKGRGPLSGSGEVESGSDQAGESAQSCL